MANVLSKDKQIAAIAALAEGSSIRSVERMTGIHRDTIMPVRCSQRERLRKLAGPEDAQPRLSPYRTG